jgi:hypothetical protein
VREEVGEAGRERSTERRRSERGGREGEQHGGWLDLGSVVLQLCCSNQKLEKLPKNHLAILVVWMLLFSIGKVAQTLGMQTRSLLE